jgi:hypothetical protein
LVVIFTLSVVFVEKASVLVVGRYIPFVGTVLPVAVKRAAVAPLVVRIPPVTVNVLSGDALPIPNLVLVLSK